MKISLHDATLDSVELKILDSTTLVLALSLYAKDEDSTRAPGTVTISNVTSISSTIDFKRQARHKSFGNIADWSPATRRGLSFFYLAGGTICVFGDAPELQMVDIN